MAQQLNNSVARAFAILRLLGRGRPRITVAEVSAELEINAITAHRFLKTLEAEGALVQMSKGSYRLGYAMVDLGDRAHDEDRLGQLLQPALDAFTAEMREASMATIYQAGMVVCIARATPPRSLSVDIRVGDRLEAYCTAHGKLWLAHLGPRERARYLETVRLDALTDHTITRRRDLEAELDVVRQRGYAYNLGEREDGITALAVPVLTRGGKMVAGLSMFGPTSRIDRAELDQGLERLRKATEVAALLLHGRAVG